MKLSPIICLMGPTGSGKTQLAVEIIKRFPCEIVSVDSAMVFRGMDIGTAKPSPEILRMAPHRLINILEPNEIYSAGQFRNDALREIDAIVAQKKIPLLVGGTMLYFRVLQQGLATLPPAHEDLRAQLKDRASKEGWDALYAELIEIDPSAAKRIHVHDSQRIQRALEVYLLTGKPISTWQEDTHPLAGYCVHNLILAPSDRALLHERIAKRFKQMLEAGFVEEVACLYGRSDLSPSLPSIRSVGYRQVWEYLAGYSDYDHMCEKAIIATRQLAKRQLTWLRAWPNALWFDANSSALMDDVADWWKQML